MEPGLAGVLQAGRMLHGGTFMVSVMHKHKFEGLVENIYGFYSDLLDEYSNQAE